MGVQKTLGQVQKAYTAGLRALGNRLKRTGWQLPLLLSLDSGPAAAAAARYLPMCLLQSGGGGRGGPARHVIPMSRERVEPVLEAGTGLPDWLIQLWMLSESNYVEAAGMLALLVVRVSGSHYPPPTENPLLKRTVAL